MLRFWIKKRHNSINYPNLIKALEVGQETELKQLLAYNETISFLPITFAMLYKMRKPNGEGRSLSVFQTHQNDGFELAIFDVPWSVSGIPFLPLILNRSNGLIYGIMLPFNELHSVLNKRQNRQISSLGQLWVKFSIEKQFGI